MQYYVNIIRIDDFIVEQYYFKSFKYLLNIYSNSELMQNI